MEIHHCVILIPTEKTRNEQTTIISLLNRKRLYLAILENISRIKSEFQVDGYELKELSRSRKFCKMVLLELSRSQMGMKIRLSFPCRSNMTDIMKLNLNKSFVFQYGNFPDSSTVDIQTYRLNIGVFQTTLFSVSLTILLFFVSKLVRLIF